MGSTAESRVAAYLALQTLARLPIHKKVSRPSILNKPKRSSVRNAKKSYTVKHPTFNYKPATNSVNLSAEQKERWFSQSPERQASYLRDHPDSIFHKLGVRRDGPKSSPSMHGDNGRSDDVSSPVQSRPMTHEERERAKRRVEALSKPDALKPNSEVRETTAATIERDGYGSIINSMQPDGVTNLVQGITGLRGSLKSQQKYNHNPNNSNKTNLTDEELEGIEKGGRDPSDRADRLSRRTNYKNVALVAGSLAVAGLLGVGLAALASPQLALVLGFQFLDHVPDYFDAGIDVLSGAVEKPKKKKAKGKDGKKPTAQDAADNAKQNEQGNQEQIQTLVNAVADYLRDATLPKDLKDQLEKLCVEPENDLSNESGQLAKKAKAAQPKKSAVKKPKPKKK